MVGEEEVVQVEALATSDDSNCKLLILKEEASERVVLEILELQSSLFERLEVRETFGYLCDVHVD